MTRSYGTPRSRRRRDTQPIPIADAATAPRRTRDPSITPLGFACFTCVRVYGADPSAPPAFATLPNPSIRTRMSALLALG